MLLKGSKIVSILDAEYRDLWERTLPREMPYRLAVYAQSQNFGDTATILYPSAAESYAREARIEVRDPLYSEGQAVLILKPVSLLDLDQLILDAEAGNSNNKLKALAHGSAFGEPIVGS